MPSGPLDLRENIGLSQSAISKITTLESLDLERPKAAAAAASSGSADNCYKLCE